MYTSKFHLIVKSTPPCDVHVLVQDVLEYKSSIDDVFVVVFHPFSRLYSVLLVALFVLGDDGFAPSIVALPEFNVLLGCGFTVASLSSHPRIVFILLYSSPAIYLEFIG